jgi:hypothetical protein
VERAVRQISALDLERADLQGFGAARNEGCRAAFDEDQDPYQMGTELIRFGIQISNNVRLDIPLLHL